MWNFVDVSRDRGAQWTLLAAGDCCPNGRFEAAFRAGHPERVLDPRIIERFSHADCALVNLETPLCGTYPPIPKAGPTLRVDPDVARGLRAASLTCVALANNHIFDYGLPGLVDTLQALDEYGISHHGAGRTHAEASLPLTRTIAGHRIALLSLAEGEFAQCVENGPGAARLDAVENDDAIRRAAASHEVVIVSVHGGNEYEPFPSPSTQRRYRAFVDAGARLVIGHHPHIPQGIERYRDGVIAYSVGNFLFDQRALYRWRSRPRQWWRRFMGTELHAMSDPGIILEVVFVGTAIAMVRAHPTRQDASARIVWAEGPERERMLAYLDAVSAPLGDGEQLRRRWEEEAVERFVTLGPQLVTWMRDVSLPDAPRQHRAALALTNILRCAAHRDVLDTALRLAAAGQLRKEPAIRDELRTLRDLLARSGGVT
ncbi:CapA family protein [Candidatus Uhrbacteria bacterium]|nr:CapA family protein [Candidatus Uhrbacteria bacterium]